MTQEQHPITPPTADLVVEWSGMAPANDAIQQNWVEIATQAARWGADQELEACCEWLVDNGYAYLATKLRPARRPKPPSLKGQAIEALAQVHHAIEQPIAITIRRALEALPDD